MEPWSVEILTSSNGPNFAGAKCRISSNRCRVLRYESMQSFRELYHLGGGVPEGRPSAAFGQHLVERFDNAVKGKH
jgi:hypothetical protein